MTRVIMVMGPGRSGTSAVAGILHHLGIDLGANFVPADGNNEAGTFEDLELFKLNRTSMPAEHRRRLSEEYVAIRNRRNPDMWAMKDPHLVEMAHHYWPYLGDDIRMIVAIRDRGAMEASFRKAYEASAADTERRYNEVLAMQQRNLAAFEGPILEIQFEELMQDPETVVRRISEFAFEGFEEPSPEKFAAAVAHIRPDIVHFKPGGKWIPREFAIQHGDWGKIAVGVRISKHPEPWFFASWTMLLTGGLRTNDIVLEPQSYMPAHWASDMLAKAFLRTKADTLLLIDDDMAFGPASLHELRQNKANQEYDVVQAFATRRTWPPTPVVYVSMRQPPKPMTLRGEWFNIDTSIRAGEIREVAAVGLAFTMIRRHVLEAMIHPKYGPEYTFFFYYGPGRESDDIPFSRNARQLGFRLAVDASVQIGHIGATTYDYNSFIQWMSQQEATAEHTDVGISVPHTMLNAFPPDAIGRILASAVPGLGGDERRAVQNILHQASTESEDTLDGQEGHIDFALQPDQLVRILEAAQNSLEPSEAAQVKTMLGHLKGRGGGD